MNIIKLLDEGKVRKHGTYDQTGIMCADIRKVSGTAGKDVNYAYIEKNGRIDIVTERNVHYGYGHFDENGHICDNANRAVFEIV